MGIVLGPLPAFSIRRCDPNCQPRRSDQSSYPSGVWPACDLPSVEEAQREAGSGEDPGSRRDAAETEVSEADILVSWNPS